MCLVFGFLLSFFFWLVCPQIIPVVQFVVLLLFLWSFLLDYLARVDVGRDKEHLDKVEASFWHRLEVQDLLIDLLRKEFADFVQVENFICEVFTCVFAPL